MAMVPTNMDTSGGDMSSGGGGGEKKTHGLITINDLNYALEPDLSVAVNRTHKRHYFQNNEMSYTQRGVCILNSGADYIDTRKSFLSMDVTVNTFKAAAFADETKLSKMRAMFGKHGSALNLIESISISTRSGDELCRIEDFCQLQNMILPYMYNQDQLSTVGGLIEYGGYLTPQIGTTNAAAVNRIVIPMFMLSPLFGYGRLMPAMLMSGLRIEIGWTIPAKAFFLHAPVGVSGNLNEPCTLPCVGEFGSGAVGTDTAITGYTIKNAYFNLCSVQLSDSIQRALNEQSAVNGLEIVYSDFERNHITIPGTTTDVNIEVRKSCSRALKAFARVTLTSSDDTSTNSKKYKFDNLRGEVGFPFSQYQWQLGSLYFPQQPVKATSTTDNTDMAKESYVMALDAFDSFDPVSNKSSYVPFRSFGMPNNRTFIDAASYQFTNQEKGVSNGITTLQAQAGSYLHDSHIIAVNLERSSLFNLAGVPINNSRVLALRATLVETKQRQPVYLRNTGTPATFDFYDISAADDAVNGNVAAEVTSPIRSVNVFLKYVKLARVFLNNVEVEQ